jgi:hypothetical protein
MTTKIEYISNRRMSRQKLLSLPSQLEFPHTPIPHPNRFLRLLGVVILIYFGAVQRLRYQFQMSYTVTPQFVCHNVPRPLALALQ